MGLAARKLRMAATGGGVIAEDTFTRADSTDLGSTEIGSFAWSETSGDTRILTNALRAVLAINVSNIAVFDPGVSNCTLTANVETSNTANRTILQLICRYVNPTNWLAINVLDIASADSFDLAKSVAGTESTPATYAAGFIQGETHEIVATFNGSSIEVFLNGVSRLTVTETDHQTATMWGARFFTGTSGDNGNSGILDLKLET